MKDYSTWWRKRSGDVYSKDIFYLVFELSKKGGVDVCNYDCMAEQFWAIHNKLA